MEAYTHQYEGSPLFSYGPFPFITFVICENFTAIYEVGEKVETSVIVEKSM